LPPIYAAIDAAASPPADCLTPFFFGIIYAITPRQPPWLITDAITILPPPRFAAPICRR